MSDLCILTASLLAQGLPGWKLAPPAWSRLSDSETTVDQVCTAASTLSTTAIPAVALHQPQFSHAARFVSTPVQPNSGSQLYAQRWAALQAGQLYTRLAADSFKSVWQQALKHPSYEDWVKLLTAEAKAVTWGQGSQKMTVLLGDSIAQWFPTTRLRRDRFWLNQGISGDTTAGVLQRLSLLDQTQPDAIYLMVGINDLRQGATDQTILSNLRRIIRQLKATHPNSSIYLHSILPTRLEAISASRISQLNDNISILTHQEGATYIDLQSVFTDDQGQLRAQLTTDGLHLNAIGYQIWQLAISPML